MEEINSVSQNLSWENPFGSQQNSAIGIDEEFIGEGLKDILDREEKLHLSAYNDACSNVTSSSVSIRSFMVESSSIEHPNHKLTVSQYIAYKSEPLGHLGDSASSQERPYFSFHERNSGKSDPAEVVNGVFNPDFSQEPSWMKKNSLSSLSSSGNLDPPLSGPNNSENWLTGKELLHQKNNSSSVKQTNETAEICPAAPPNPDDVFKVPMNPIKIISPPIQLEQPHSMIHPEENSELPSLYWKPLGPNQSTEIAEISVTEECRKSPNDQHHSLVVGHFDALTLKNSSSNQSSGNAGYSNSQSSTSPTSTVRENTEFSTNCHSMMSEPQLSSTREISADDLIEAGPSSAKKVTFHPKTQQMRISHVSLENPSSSDYSQDDAPAVRRRLLVADDENQKAKNDWRKMVEELTIQEQSCVSPESWMAVFTNTSSLSTPSLMNKIKEHVLRHKNVSSVESSGIGASGFDMSTETNKNNGVDHPKLSMEQSVSKDNRSCTPTSTADVGGSNNKFTRLTSTVIKKVPENHSTKPVSSDIINMIKCNKTHVFFGGAPLKTIRRQSIVLRNSSFQHRLEMELRIKDCDDFKIVDGPNSVLVSRLLIQLEAREERAVDLEFLPLGYGCVSTKLNLYPRGGAINKVKYTVDLSGYGGSSQVHSSVSNGLLVPKSANNGAFWSCEFYLENQGTIPAYTSTQPLIDDTEKGHCVLLPQSSIINAGESRKIKMLIHPSKDQNKNTMAPFKLMIYSGDNPLRIRWTRSIASGLAMKNIDQLDWNSLLQLDYSESSLPGTEEDMTLFYDNMKTEVINVVVNDCNRDSKFLTLAMETATMLESSCSAETRLPTVEKVNNSAVASAASVSAGVTELIFPSTKAGAVSSQKIPLQNWSSQNQEVRVQQINGPFKMKHVLSVVPGGYYTRLPILFHPTKSGHYSGNVQLQVGANRMNIALKGEAF